MLLIPAIDLKDGNCVRLRQGRMEDDTLFDADPLAPACDRTLSDLAPGGVADFTCAQGGATVSYTNQITVTAAADLPPAPPDLDSFSICAYIYRYRKFDFSYINFLIKNK